MAKQMFLVTVSTRRGKGVRAFRETYKVKALTSYGATQKALELVRTVAYVTEEIEDAEPLDVFTRPAEGAY